MYCGRRRHTTTAYLYKQWGSICERLAVWELAQELAVDVDGKALAVDGNTKEDILALWEGEGVGFKL